MDNKRKVIGTFAGKPSKLRKVNVFDTEDDDAPTSNEQSSTQSNANQTPVSVTVDPEQQEVITKTALWIFSNPDKASILLEKAKENPTLSFLNDTKGETASGRLYLRELARLRTEREVQAVCAGTPQEPAVHVSVSQIANFININKQAAAASAVSQYSATSYSVPAAATEATPRERRNRWGPSVDQPSSSGSSGVSVPPPSHTPSAYHGNTPQYTAPAPPQAPSSSSAKGMHRSAATQPSEADQIAHMAATFDRTPAEDQLRLDKLLQEQREMQLLESRIRDAATQGFHTGGSAGSAGHSSVTEVAKFLAEHAAESTAKRTANGEPDPYAVHLAARKGPALLIAEKQAALYLERLAQYEELARNEDDKYRDTVEECERNGGVIEGGTWEHRKRAKEMLQTAAKNLELTLLGAGKHHMADYLPPEVLQSFLRNAEAVTGHSGAAGPATQAVADSTRLDASNVGFQLLRKSGWAEGAGLGAQGTGIVDPISATGSNAVMVSVNASSAGCAGLGGGPSAVAVAGGRGPEGAGIGVQATHDVTAEDTEFDQYRKRMMLAYRFRPNPLNNPRRNYY